MFLSCARCIQTPCKWLAIYKSHLNTFSNKLNKIIEKPSYSCPHSLSRKLHVLITLQRKPLNHILRITITITIASQCKATDRFCFIFKIEDAYMHLYSTEVNIHTKLKTKQPISCLICTKNQARVKMRWYRHFSRGGNLSWEPQRITTQKYSCTFHTVWEKV